MTKLAKIGCSSALALIFISIAAYFFYADCIWALYTNPDAGWIVRTGQYIAAQGFPKVDPFTWTKTSQHVMAYQWIWDLLCGSLFQIGSLWLVGFTSTLLLGTLVFFFLPRLWIAQGLPLFLPFAALAFIFTPNWFHCRPQLCSYFLSLGFILLLERYRTSKDWRWLAPLPLLSLLWANTHLLWTLGLALTAIYAGCQWLRQKAPPKQLLICLAASTVACAINPWGLGLLGYALTFLNGSQYSNVYEMQPSFTSLDGLLAVSCLPVAWLVLFRGRHKVPMEGFVIAIMLSLAAVAIRRFQPLAIICMWTYLGLALASPIVEQPAAEQPTAEKPRRRFAITRPFATASLLLLSLIIPTLSWYMRMPSMVSAWMAYTEDSLPLLLVMKQVLTSQDRMFNEPTIGSWLVALENNSVFVDTRFDIYPKQFLDQMNDCLNGKGSWKARLDEWGINYVVTRDATPLNQMMMYQPGWTLVLHDGKLAWWSRDTVSSYETLKHYGLTDELISKCPLPKNIQETTIETRAAKYLLLSRVYREHNQMVRALDAAQRGVNLEPSSAALQKELASASQSL